MLISLKKRIKLLNIKNSKLKNIEKTIRLSGLFNEQWYLDAYPDVKKAELDPIRHYIEFGYKEGREPSPDFDSKSYVIKNPDVRTRGLIPLYHFIKYGNHLPINNAIISENIHKDSHKDNPTKYISKNLQAASNHFKKTSKINTLGSIDSLSDGYLHGWFQPNKEIGIDRLDLWLGNKLLTPGVEPSIIRPDVQAIHGGDIFCGFLIDLSMFILKEDEVLSLRNSKDQTTIYSKDIKELFNNISSKSNTEKSKLDNLMLDCDAHQLYLQNFDSSFYLLENEDIAKDGVTPLRHYIVDGYKELRKPSHNFDLIWYTHNYLDSDWSIDALYDYAISGNKYGHLTSPQTPIHLNKTFTYPLGYLPRRICLFAGYDKDGIIDDVVIEYITEIAKYSDVYYLADCAISSSELDKLKTITKGAWGFRHGCYDFGSWSLLAKKLIGWKVIESYDELIFTNDSSYLVKSFEPVFSKMDRQRCAWWGLQATKGTWSTFATQGLKETVKIEDIKLNWLSDFETDKSYDFHLGSYFLVFRNTIIKNKKLQLIFNNIQEEISKDLIIKKYEIGLTRFLISQGYEFSTFVNDVYPLQPIYTDTSFTLISEGFPLLKKYHLIENHYKIEELWRWKERLTDSGVRKDLSIYEHNLNRTGDADKLYNNMDISLYLNSPPLDEVEILAEDLITPKYDSWWCFPVCSYSHRFNDNIRALFEEVKDESSIKKIILTRTKKVSLEGKNIIILPLASREGQYYLLRSRHIFLKHGVRSNLGVNLSKDLHAFHNLWHGIPLKRIGYASIDQQSNLLDISEQNSLLKSVISASKIDQLAMTAAYWPLTINDVWLTGLPRHDLILKDENLLPIDMLDQLKKLRATLHGRKLILFAPTFRNDQKNGYFKFTEEQISSLTLYLKQNNFVLGIREHMADISRQYSSQLTSENFIIVPESIYPNVEVILREAIFLITDYSSIFIDFLTTGRPVISFAYDYEHYAKQERGLFYDLEWCFPGTIAKNFVELHIALTNAAKLYKRPISDDYVQKRKLFLDNVDCHNSYRVIDKIKNTNEGDLTIFELSKTDFLNINPKFILWIYDKGQEITARYRIFNIAPEMNKLGWACKIVASDEIVIDDIAQAGTIVFSRVVATDTIMDILEGTQRRGTKVIFDIDDLIFSEEGLLQAEYYLHRSEKRAEIRRMSKGYVRLMLAADVITVSTNKLKHFADKYSALVFVVPNSLGISLIEEYNTSYKVIQTNGVIQVCYLAGTKTHADDFSLIKKAVETLQKENPSTIFNVVGNVAYDDNVNDALLIGWKRHPLMSYEKLHTFLSKMDINLAPLTSSDFNNCKSELKIFEASLHSIPTIASNTGTYADVVVNHINGVLADTSDDWYIALKNLIDDNSKRISMGYAAKETIMQNFTAKNSALIFHEIISNSK